MGKQTKYQWIASFLFNDALSQVKQTVPILIIEFALFHEQAR